MQLKILNLYSGIGGNRLNWGNNHQITNIEINPELCKILRHNFPNDKTIETDAMEYLKENYQNYDFIWASPPCQTHSQMNRINTPKFHKHDYIDPSLYQIIIFLQENFKGGYVVENVKPYYGLAFNPVIYHRHAFWTNYDIQCLNYIPKKQNLLDMSLKQLQQKFRIKTTKNIYLGNSHDPKAIFRNAVCPILAKLILQRFESKHSIQTTLFHVGGIK